MPYANASYGKSIPEWLRQIDWSELNKQKRLLVNRIWKEPDSDLWGIVHLYDAMQDWAVDSGHKAMTEVWDADIKD